MDMVQLDKKTVAVAPLAGAWIEICSCVPYSTHFIVAPLAGAWIEIPIAMQVNHNLSRSLPLRERGLKSGDRTR